MSIYASAWGTDAEDHADDCGRWVPVERGHEPEHVSLAYWADGTVSYADDSRPCTCQAGPIVYRASHILPSDTDERHGSVDFAEIPGWINGRGRPPVDPDETWDRIWPWLRLWVDTGGDGAVVLLDRRQVEQMHIYLGQWLDRAVDASGREGALWG